MAKIAKNGQGKAIGDDVKNFLEGKWGQLPDLS